MNREYAARARILSRERGTIRKDWGGKAPLVLAYPNTYHVGMSSLGFQAIYGLFNSYQDIVCERAFWHPGLATASLGRPPLSLESGHPLADFAAIAFSLSFELDYPHVVHLLRASGVPLLSSQRDRGHPLVLAGGPAITTNPEPMAHIVDAFVLGEGEAVLPRLAPVLAQGFGENREHLLLSLAELPGVYVPQIASREKPIARQQVKSLHDLATASVVLTPDTELGGRYLMEIARGCAWACRFCLAGHLFRPLRLRPLEAVLAQAREGLKHGPRLGLVSAAISDYPRLGELASALYSMGAQLSVSSLRPNPLPEPLLEALALGGAHTLTLAPETGQQLRDAAGKGLRDEDFLEAAERAARYPFQQLKLYFMVGLPGEQEADMEKIVRLAREMKGRLERRGNACQVSVNASPFVPKAQTPFEREAMAPPKVLETRLGYLARELRPRGIKVAGESVGWSLVQGHLARGDARLGLVLARLEENTLAEWRRALSAEGLDPKALHRPVPQSQGLPWDHLRTVEAVAMGQDVSQ